MNTAEGKYLDSLAITWTKLMTLQSQTRCLELHV